MAKLLVLTDLLPDDTDWKGALTWKIILSLAEGQHEVRVATSLDPGPITITHPRLTIIRPVKSWRVDQAPHLAKAVITYQPQVIHTLALKSSRMWPMLTVWPYLSSLCKVLPNVRRFTTLFEESDWAKEDPSFIWHQMASRVTVFSESHKYQVRQALSRPTEILPLEVEVNDLAESGIKNQIVIPCPVSEWKAPTANIQALADYLNLNPDANVRILGGWGSLPHSERKLGWMTLGKGGARVAMTEPVSLNKLQEEMAQADAIWLEPLMRDSWKFLMGSHMTQQMKKRPILSGSMAPALLGGSTANSLSRLYSSP